MCKLFLFLMILIFSASAMCVGKYKYVVLETNQGNIKLKLYENTPKHSENFLKLVKEKHYDGLLFHRVIKDFMIQSGSSDSRNAEKGKMLGTGDPGYTLEAESRPENIHKKGALCAARQSDEANPEKRSSGEQFYIVQGRVCTDQELDAVEQQRMMREQNKLGAKLFRPKQEEYKNYLTAGQKAKADSLISDINKEIEKQFADYNIHFSPAAREAYKTVGGTPFLDGDYTVFGEVIEGMDIVDKIAGQSTDKSDRPEEDIVILKALIKRK